MEKLLKKSDVIRMIENLGIYCQNKYDNESQENLKSYFEGGINVCNDLLSLVDTLNLQK